MGDTSTWTIRAVQRLGMELNGICDACQGLFDFNLNQLAEGFGADTPLPSELEAGCPNCGADLRIVIATPGHPVED